MKILRGLPVLALLAACGGDAVTVRGSLLEGNPATEVYVVGQPLRAAVEADSFVIEGVPGEVVELEFAEEGERLGRMRIEQWSGRDLALRGIWFDDGVAYASALDGETRAVINGLRMAGPEALPSSINAAGRVLALSRDADALVLRPLEEGLPDLRVLVTPGTAFEWESGEPADVFVNIGDTLRVEGQVEAGYVVATALVLPDPPAEEGISEPVAGVTAEDGGDPSPAAVQEQSEKPTEAARDARDDGPRSLTRPGHGKGRGRGLQKRKD